jgi:hypothetical protein
MLTPNTLWLGFRSLPEVLHDMTTPGNVYIDPHDGEEIFTTTTGKYLAVIEEEYDVDSSDDEEFKLFVLNLRALPADTNLILS